MSDSNPSVTCEAHTGEASPSPARVKEEDLKTLVEFKTTADVVQDGKNKQTIYCSRCTSVILNPNVGFFTSDNKREVPKMTQRVDDDVGTETDTITECFRVDDMYDFENVGYSFNHNDVKYLTCADCEYGPLGWFKDMKSYVALSRVRYHVPSDKQS